MSLAIVVIKSRTWGAFELSYTLDDAAQSGRGSPTIQSQGRCPGPLSPSQYPRPNSSPAQESQTPWPPES